jgi:hypothetical protein
MAMISKNIICETCHEEYEMGRGNAIDVAEALRLFPWGNHEGHMIWDYETAKTFINFGNLYNMESFTEEMILANYSQLTRVDMTHILFEVMHPARYMVQYNAPPSVDWFTRDFESFSHARAYVDTFKMSIKFIISVKGEVIANGLKV